MLRSIGTKDGTILYHIGYNTVLGCSIINGVISCGRRKCWLIGIGLVTKFGCGQICCTSTPTCAIGAFGTTNCKEFMSYSFINLFSLSSTKG